MVEQTWLLDEVTPPDLTAIEQTEEDISFDTRGSAEVQAQPANLAVRLQDIIIWDTKKWFGDADVRLDALVVHGPTGENQQQSFYMP